MKIYLSDEFTINVFCLIKQSFLLPLPLCIVFNHLNVIISGWGSETKTSNDQWTSTNQEDTSTSQNYWSGWTSEPKETSTVTSDYGSNTSQTQWAGWGYDNKDSNHLWTDDTNSASKDTTQNYWVEQTDQESNKTQVNELQTTLSSNEVTPPDNQWADWTSTTRHSIDLSEPAIMENLWQKSFGKMWHSVMFC